MKLPWALAGLPDVRPVGSGAQDRWLDLPRRVMSVLPVKLLESRVRWFKGWIKPGVKCGP